MSRWIGRRFLITTAVVAALALPISALWAAAQRPALDSMLQGAKAKITEVSVQQAKGLLEGGTLFVDVRTGGEYAAGHLPGAMHLDRGMLEFQVETKVPDKTQAIVVYCKSGGRGSLATATLMEMGYTNVKNMAGGYLAWEKAGYPTVK